MSNNNKQYKKSKVLNGVLGGLLALVVAGGVAFVGVLSNGFKNWDNIKPPAQEEPNSPDDNTTKGEASIENGESVGIRLMAAKIPVAEYKTYGVSVQAETAYTVTATVYPEDAANQKVDWSVSFANASSAWASGKKVTDYVTVTPLFGRRIDGSRSERCGVRRTDCCKNHFARQYRRLCDFERRILTAHYGLFIRR